MRESMRPGWDLTKKKHTETHTHVHGDIDTHVH